MGIVSHVVIYAYDDKIQEGASLHYVNVAVVRVLL